MKHKKTFGFIALIALLGATFIFAGNSQGHRGVGEFDLALTLEDQAITDSFHVEKSVAIRRSQSHVSLFLSDNPNLSCEVNEKLLLDDHQIILSIDMFVPDDEVLELGRYARKGEYRLGPSIRVGLDEILFSGRDIGSVELTEINMDEEIISGEIDIHDIENRVVEGAFEARVCSL